MKLIHVMTVVAASQLDVRFPKLICASMIISGVCVFINQVCVFGVVRWVVIECHEDDMVSHKSICTRENWMIRLLLFTL